MKSSILILISATICLAKIDSTFTLNVNANRDSVKLQVATWEKRMGATADEKINTINDNGSKGIIAAGDLKYLATSYKIRIDSISTDSSRVNMSWKSYLSDEGKEFIYPKINDAFKQCIGEKIPNGKNIEQKSLAKYLGYSLINPGVGALYLKDNNFTYTTGYPLIIASTAVDAGMVALTIANPKSRPMGLTFIALYRALSLLGIPALNLHNKFSESGYQYSF